MPIIKQEDITVNSSDWQEFEGLTTSISGKDKKKIGISDVLQT